MYKRKMIPSFLYLISLSQISSKSKVFRERNGVEKKLDNVPTETPDIFAVQIALAKEILSQIPTQLQSHQQVGSQSYTGQQRQLHIPEDNALIITLIQGSTSHTVMAIG